MLGSPPHQARTRARVGALAWIGDHSARTFAAIQPNGTFGHPPGLAGPFRLPNQLSSAAAPHTCAVTATADLGSMPSRQASSPETAPRSPPITAITRSRNPVIRMPVIADGLAARTNAAIAKEVPANQSRWPSHIRSNP
ncbi:hypothetical protein GCM10023321_70120 [Pseudonocardia eucalypti]|uniref:Uncharacterized protein n=1 Tax=Pseudonocardia eucalypti TaxID=648755 RepID=A0ABP9R4D4_9PSEU